MARDPRKSSAFDSGMRGKDKPKVSGNVGGDKGGRGPSGSSGSEDKQEAGKTVGDANGVGLDAYSSGMRGNEKPKQKSAARDANQQVSGSAGGENKQGASTKVGEPAGHDDAAEGQRKGFSDSEAQSKASGAYKPGTPGNNTEAAAFGKQPSSDGIIGEEDDTHINVRIPKASLKKKQGGVNAG